MREIFYFIPWSLIARTFELSINEKNKKRKKRFHRRPLAQGNARVCFRPFRSCEFRQPRAIHERRSIADNSRGAALIHVYNGEDSDSANDQSGINRRQRRRPPAAVFERARVYRLLINTT